MTHHYQEFASSYEQLPRFHRPNTWGDFFMTGGEIVMTGRILHIGGVWYIRRGENFSRVRNRRGETFACKNPPRGRISPGKIPPAGEDLGGRTYNGTPALSVKTAPPRRQLWRYINEPYLSVTPYTVFLFKSLLTFSISVSFLSYEYTSFLCFYVLNVIFCVILSISF